MKTFYADFQRKVSRCFVELKKLMSQLGKQYEPLASDFHLKTVTFLEEFGGTEEELENGAFNKLMVHKINLVRVNKSLSCF